MDACKRSTSYRAVARAPGRSPLGMAALATCVLPGARTVPSALGRHKGSPPSIHDTGIGLGTPCARPMASRHLTPGDSRQGLPVATGRCPPGQGHRRASAGPSLPGSSHGSRWAARLLHRAAGSAEPPDRATEATPPICRGYSTELANLSSCRMTLPGGACQELNKPSTGRQLLLRAVS